MKRQQKDVTIIRINIIVVNIYITFCAKFVFASVSNNFNNPFRTITHYEANRDVRSNK